MDDFERRSRGCSLEAHLDDPELTDGQRRRLRLLWEVEELVSDRIEQLCMRSKLNVTDAAVLVVGPGARQLFAGADRDSAFAVTSTGIELDDSGSTLPGPSVVVGHRVRLHGYLHAAVPPADEAPCDPYADLLEPSPPQCVRVLIVDDESLTILSYGAFLTISVGDEDVPRA